MGLWNSVRPKMGDNPRQGDKIGSEKPRDAADAMKKLVYEKLGLNR